MNNTRKDIKYDVNETGCHICTSHRKKELRLLKHKIFELHKGKRQPDEWICHTCGNSKCINPEHLFLNTTGDISQKCKMINRKAWQRELTYNITDSGCWECNSHAINSNGYITIHHNGKYTNAHRVMYEKHKSQIPFGMCVLHSCDNRKCINPDHLFLGTNADNMRDMCLKGRHGKSIRKLDESTVRKIIIAIGTYQEIANQFDTSLFIVKRIRTGKTWKNISIDENSIPTDIIDSILS